MLEFTRENVQEVVDIMTAEYGRPKVKASVGPKAEYVIVRGPIYDEKTVWHQRSKDFLHILYRHFFEQGVKYEETSCDNEGFVLWKKPREGYEHEDFMYYLPEYRVDFTEDNIDLIVSKLVEREVGLLCAYGVVFHGGERIEVGKKIGPKLTPEEKAKRAREEDPERIRHSHEEAKREWEETAINLIWLLGQKLDRVYEIYGIGHRGFTIWTADDPEARFWQFSEEMYKEYEKLLKEQGLDFQEHREQYDNPLLAFETLKREVKEKQTV